MTKSSISILDIVHDTTVDGPGFRTSIYAAGCRHACPGCHNPQSWDIGGGKRITVDALFETVVQAEFANVSFTGGDPLMQAGAFTELARRIKTETRKTIWCYTGYTFEQVVLSPSLSQILPHLDVLVDGRFIAAQKDESLRFRGSHNQRIIDVGATMRTGVMVMYDTDDSITPGTFRLHPSNFPADRSIGAKQ